jgi:tagatose-1,6-bisphosphate aldolase
MAGRALWREVVTAPEHARAEMVIETMRPRFRELATIAVEHGRDWADRHALPAVDETWYRGY